MSKEKEDTTEYWVDFIADTLKQLDAAVQGAFLQKFLQALVGQEITKELSKVHWEAVLARRTQLADKLSRAVTLRTAAMDYFEEVSLLRNPVLLEYEDLKKLRQNAVTDPLTGLANRRVFEEFLDQEIDRGARYGFPFALLSLDLRYFKSVNDLYGHAAGDDILRNVARISLETIRGSDIACRTGGDEFAILLPQAEREGSEVLADRIARKFDEYAHSTVPGASVAIDYGIAIFPEDGPDAAGLFDAADRKLYAAKQDAHKRSENRAERPQPDAEPIREPPVQREAEEVSPEDEQSQYPVDEATTTIPGQQDALSNRSDASGRRFERIRLEEAPALGIVRLWGKSNAVRILDASRGGVGLLIDQTDLPETFPAFLPVPILPPGELTLQRIYSLPYSDRKLRVGCALTPLPGTAGAARAWPGRVIIPTQDTFRPLGTGATLIRKR